MKKEDENSFTIEFYKIKITAKGYFAIGIAAFTALLLISMIILITKGII